MQSSQVLSLAWSPVRSGEFVLATKDGGLRVWHLDDFDNALLVGNYKKIPMFHLRYTVRCPAITLNRNPLKLLQPAHTTSIIISLPCTEASNKSQGVVLLNTKRSISEIESLLH